MTTKCSVAVPHYLDADADPDHTFHFDLDPDPTFHSDSVPGPTLQFNADPDPDQAFHFLMWIRIRILIQLHKMMWIHANPNP